MAAKNKQLRKVKFLSTTAITFQSVTPTLKQEEFYWLCNYVWVYLAFSTNHGCLPI